MGSMDSVIVSSGKQQQGLESDGFMVLGSWKENLLVPLEFDKIYSMQFFAPYVNKIPWNSLRQVRGSVWCLSALSCFLSLLCERDMSSDIMVMSNVTVKQVWLLYLNDVLCALIKGWRWWWTVLDRMVKECQSCPLQSCSWEFCHFHWLVVKRNLCSWQKLYWFSLMCNWFIERKYFTFILY